MAIAMAVCALQAAPAIEGKLAVQGMTCATCPVTIKLALKREPGVVSTSVDFKKQSATVKFDPDRTSIERLAAAVTKAGFPAQAAK
ncbi:MAG: heavy-metal-associated domain-containing protein [Betaproteobacteria bacterium]|nr:heavy-metal-associated domain-containing protein [Betaproteobacteria bacterium]